MHLKVTYYTSNTSPASYMPVHDLMAQAANAAHPYMDDTDYVEWAVKPYLPGHQEITVPGAKDGGMVIWDHTRGEAVALKKYAPSEISAGQLAKDLKFLWGYSYDPDTGKYVSDDKGSVLPTNDGFLPGFPLFGNLSLSLPWWAYAAAALLLAGNSASARSGVMAALWGGGALYTGHTAIKKYQNG